MTVRTISVEPPSSSTDIACNARLMAPSRGVTEDSALSALRVTAKTLQQPRRGVWAKKPGWGRVVGFDRMRAVIEVHDEAGSRVRVALGRPDWRPPGPATPTEKKIRLLWAAFIYPETLPLQYRLRAFIERLDRARIVTMTPVPRRPPGMVF